jgi:hypothetical protein
VTTHREGDRVSGDRTTVRAGRSTGVVLRFLAAGALLVSAYVHADLASPPYYAAGQLTLAALFGVQAAAAVAAVWLLVRGARWALVAAAVVGFASLLALVSSVYVRVPAFGPFPVLYEPYWYAPKVVAAVAAAVAGGSAGAALVSRSVTPASSGRRSSSS